MSQVPLLSAAVQAAPCTQQHCQHQHHGGDHHVVRSEHRQAGSGAEDPHPPGGPVLRLLPLLQEQHHEQRRQSKVQARSVKGEETPQQAAQCCARNPVEVVQQGEPEVEVPPGHAFRRLQSGHQGKRLVAQHVDQKRPNLSQALVFVQQAQPVEHVPGIDHDGQQKRLHGVKSRSQQRDGQVAITGAALTIQRSEAMEVLTQTINKANGSNPDLVAVMGGEPEEMFRRAISELGGMKQFVKPGQKVVVKPNIGWDKVPELAGNTNPKLIEEIVRQCFAAGAKEVVVFDHTCDDWQKCYKNSGIEAAAKKAGAKVMPAHLESYYKPIDLPKGKKMKKAKVHEAILDCDVWINVPILKNHGGANLTISMKNHMGIVWDRGFFHQNDLQQCIADICTLQKKAVLNVVDAYRIMKTNGPRGRSASDVVLAKGLFISPDIVAVDTAAAKFFNQVREMPLDTVGHLANGEALKIGTMNIDKLNVKRIKM